jgi:hypothetical protein
MHLLFKADNYSVHLCSAIYRCLDTKPLSITRSVYLFRHSDLLALPVSDGVVASCVRPLNWTMRPVGIEPTHICRPYALPNTASVGVRLSVGSSQLRSSVAFPACFSDVMTAYRMRCLQSHFSGRTVPHAGIEPTA